MERSCECGADVSALPPAVSHCWIHHEDEPVPSDAYRVCGECFHVYATPADFETAYRLVVAEMGDEDAVPRELKADDIFFCQECLHDF